MSLWNNIYLYFRYKKPPTSDVIQDTMVLTEVVLSHDTGLTV